MRMIRLAGTVPPEVWNRLGTKILPKLRAGSELKIGLVFSVTVPPDTANGLVNELRQILQELGQVWDRRSNRSVMHLID